MNFYITVAIDFLGIIIGLISIWYIFRIKDLLGGRLGGGISFFIWGVIFMILAFGYTVIFTRFKLFTAPGVDPHHALMTIGMVFFVIVASRFAGAIRNI